MLKSAFEQNFLFGLFAETVIANNRPTKEANGEIKCAIRAKTMLSVQEEQNLEVLSHFKIWIRSTSSKGPKIHNQFHQIKIHPKRHNQNKQPYK